MKNCTTKTIYLGMDVRKKTYAFNAICDGRVVKRSNYSRTSYTITQAFSLPPFFYLPGALPQAFITQGVALKANFSN